MSVRHAMLREEVKSMGLSKAFVVYNHPGAYICKTKGKVDVRRPRTADDPSALVPYVLMSGYHLTDLLAWDEACVNVMKELNGR